MIDDILNFLLRLIGDVKDDSDINEKLKVMEREKLRYDLKRLRRK